MHRIFLSAGLILLVLCASDTMSGSGGRCRFANLLGDSRSFTPEEEALFDATAEFAYRSFRDKAAASRGMAVEAMQAVAQVRVAGAGGFVTWGGGKFKQCCCGQPEWEYACVQDVLTDMPRSLQQAVVCEQGRVWSGRDAVGAGLVDALGGVARAVAILKDRAGIPAGDQVHMYRM